MNRRSFLAATAGASLAVPFRPAAGFETKPAAELVPTGLDFNLRQHFAEPVVVKTIEPLRLENAFYIRCTTADGSVGVTWANDKLDDLLSLLSALVIPFFVGKDARDLPSLVDDVYAAGRNYKYSGMPFWNAVGNVELCLLDLLGRKANLPAGQLLGEFKRTTLPVYLSRFNRDNTAKDEVAAAARDIARTGATAVKFKTGRRMSNTPAQTRRDLEMVRLARETFGDTIAIYLDANGSYTSAEEGIEVGLQFQKLGADFLEEPCPWEDFVATKRVADELEMTVAGGEQDSSRPKFAWMIENRAVDLIQPDLFYNGGLIRCLRVAAMAEAAGLRVTPHSPRSGPAAAPTLHLMGLISNPGDHMEYQLGSPAEIPGGRLSIPNSAGFGLEYESRRFAKAERL